MVLLNVAMLLATPIEGNHYLSDMVAGVAVAAISLVVVRIGLRWWSAEPVAESRFSLVDSLWQLGFPDAISRVF